jgi:hypothetical protein
MLLIGFLNTPPGRPCPALLLSPAVTIGCRIAMNIAMAFMLFIAI